MATSSRFAIAPVPQKRSKLDRVLAACFIRNVMNRKITRMILVGALALAANPILFAETFPGTDEGAKQLANAFLKPGADCAALSKQLRPSAADYAAVFDADFGTKVAAAWDPAWEAGKMVMAPKPGQTEVKISSATTDELKAGTGNAAELAGGWKDAAAKMKPGLKVYRCHFLEPGKTAGMSFDGLIYVNGNWRVFPKPWRALEN